MTTYITSRDPRHQTQWKTTTSSSSRVLTCSHVDANNCYDGKVHTIEMTNNSSYQLQFKVCFNKQQENTGSGIISSGVKKENDLFLNGLKDLGHKGKVETQLGEGNVDIFTLTVEKGDGKEPPVESLRRFLSAIERVQVLPPPLKEEIYKFLEVEDKQSLLFESGLIKIFGNTGTKFNDEQYQKHLGIAKQNNSPEFYLLVARACASHNYFHQALDAAQQGLRCIKNDIVDFYAEPGTKEALNCVAAHAMSRLVGSTKAASSEGKEAKEKHEVVSLENALRYAMDAGKTDEPEELRVELSKRRWGISSEPPSISIDIADFTATYMQMAVQIRSLAASNIELATQVASAKTASTATSSSSPTPTEGSKDGTAEPAKDKDKDKEKEAKLQSELSKSFVALEPTNISGTLMKLQDQLIKLGKKSLELEQELSSSRALLQSQAGKDANTGGGLLSWVPGLSSSPAPAAKAAGTKSGK